MESKNSKPDRAGEWRKKRKRALHKLQSIHRDAAFVTRVVDGFVATTNGGELCPVLANQRAGSWYVQPRHYKNHHHNEQQIHESCCYFKSTDGHTDVWNFSLKRLNLQVIDAVAKSKSSAVLVVDASKTKNMPDAFSRTLPIWCCVMNRVALRYREQQAFLKQREENQVDPTGPLHLDEKRWDVDLYVPPDIVSSEEKGKMMARIEHEHVQTLWESNLVDIEWLLRTLQKPLRPHWIVNHGDKTEIDFPKLQDMESYAWMICVSASSIGANDDDVVVPPWYTPGAADDHESWSMGLTEYLFWQNVNQLLPNNSNNNSYPVSANDCDRIIEKLVRRARQDDEEWQKASGAARQLLEDEEGCCYNFLGSSDSSSKLAIGTRRAGRPPECWDQFDAIVNVTTLEYDNIAPPHDNVKYYLCCPVKEGKKDKLELEQWLSVAIVFVLANLQVRRRVLIHCSQGQDRSVAVAMAVTVLCLNVEQDFELFPWCLQEDASMTSLEMYIVAQLGEKAPRSGEGDNGNVLLYKHSGFKSSLVSALMGRQGRNLLLQWIQTIKRRGSGDANVDENDPLMFADKTFMQLVLQKITRYHGRSAPSRTTMQKLNRYFMSSEYEMV